MNLRWKCLLFFISLLLLTLWPIQTQSQECRNCDCDDWPVRPSCRHCCQVVTGTVTSVTPSNLTVDGKSFQFDKAKTKTNGELKAGTPVTVYSRRYNDGSAGTSGFVRTPMAERIDVVDSLTGLLKPGDAPDPPVPSNCTEHFGDIPETALRLYVGDSLGFTNHDSITALRVKDHPILSIRRTAKGVAINAETYGLAGETPVVIVDNHFYIKPNGFFRIARPDSHTLSVYEQDTKILDVRYINPHSVTASGIFRIPGASPIVISQSRILVGNIPASSICARNLGIIALD